MARAPTLQIGIIGLVGLVAAALSFTANIIRNGWLTAIASATIIIIILTLTVSQIRCVVFGRCYFTSWLNTFIGASILGSAGLYYLLALTNGLPLPSIDQQPIATANPNIKYVTDMLKNRLNFDVYTFVNSGSTQERTNSQVVA